MSIVQIVNRAMYRIHGCVMENLLLEALEF